MCNYVSSQITKIRKSNYYFTIMQFIKCCEEQCTLKPACLYNVSAPYLYCINAVQIDLRNFVSECIIRSHSSCTETFKYGSYMSSFYMRKESQSSFKEAQTYWEKIDLRRLLKSYPLNPSMRRLYQWVNSMDSCCNWKTSGRRLYMELVLPPWAAKAQGLFSLLTAAGL